MAELSTRWWKKAKPSKLTSDPLERALREYETAARGKVVRQEVRDALMEVQFAVSDVERQVKTLLKSNPIQYRTLSKELTELKSLADTENGRIARQSDRLTKVWTRDYGGAIDKLVRPYGGSMGKVMIALHLYEHQIEVLEAAHVENQVFQAVNAAFDDAVRRCEKVLDAQLREHAYRTRAFFDSLLPSFIEIAEDLERTVGEVPEKTLQKAAKNAQIAKDYKRDKAVTITIQSLSFGGSIAGVFMPGTTAVAIVAAVRSAAGLAKEIVKVARSLEQAINVLNREIKILVKSYKTAVAETPELRRERNAKETAKILGNALLGADVLVTVGKCQEDLGEVQGKLGVLADKLPKLEKFIMEAIEKSGALERSLKAAALPGSRSRGKLEKKLDSLAGKLDKSLDEASDSMARVTRAEKEYERLEHELEQFEDIAKDMKTAEKILKAIVNLAFSAGGMADSIVASTAAINVAANTIGMATAIESEVVGALE